MGFIKSSRAIGILIFFILLAAVSLTVIVSQQQQSTKQRATGFDNACAPPYEGYLGCFGLGNSPPDSICVSSCTDPNGAAGQYCYSSTKVGNTCVTESNLIGSCNDRGSCVSTASASIPIPEPTQTPASISQSSDDIYYACLRNCGNGFGDEFSCADSCSSSAVNVPTPQLTQIPTSTSTPTITLAPITTVITPTGIPVAATVQNIPTPSSVAYCYLKSQGDANCDNIINILDFESWRIEFVGMLKGIPIINKPSDFNNDGLITIVDFNIWKTNFQDPSLPH